MASSSPFVRRNGNQFELNGERYLVHGWNTYWLMTKAKGQLQEVEQVMADGKSMGLNVCRTWGFFDGPNGLQKSPGVFDETMFQGLDLAVATAKKYGIKLIPALCNNWGSYGGKEQYVSWSTGSKQPGDAFYTDAKCKEYYKNYVKAWVQEMAKYVKSLDPNHMVGTGSEGFYGPGEGSNACNPADWAATQGTDFVRDHKIAEIDFTSAHLYPDHWLAHNLPLVDIMKWMTKWISRHIDDSNAMGKPLLIAEFNLRKEPDSSPLIMSNRAAFLGLTYDWLFASVQNKGAGAGALFWHLLTPGTRGNADGFAVFKDQDPEVIEVITSHSKRLDALRKVLKSPAPAAGGKTATA
ncbi:hypothetical protein CBR_g1118 [Chara braunii]|uniref:mannan endo-1,4-beta-mannosidase n=1 Tax=Chara braunii TaxID=69332 RepID=A0A388KD78_CHABU|nr:hypothetical protein CBR_g1118 [Chara braunii]|eukprot:GBG67999.1 hypothetical protein CBR_g1118 [Chara braunii]